jgi:hypothetical protein
VKTSVIIFFAVSIGYSQANKITALNERENSLAFFAGMGIHMVAAPDIVEYINTVTTFSQRVDDFGTVVEFFGGAEFPVNKEWGIKFEHSYLFKSYTVPGNLGGTHDLYYSVQSPSLLVQKTYSGKGYFFKIGAGGGYNFGYVSQKVSTFGITTEYTSRGLGLKAEAVGQTAFDENFFGYIGASLGWGFLGDLKDNKGFYLSAPNSAARVSLRYFHAGLRFGVVQYF